MSVEDMDESWDEEEDEYEDEWEEEVEFRSTVDAIVGVVVDDDGEEHYVRRLETVYTSWTEYEQDASVVEVDLSDWARWLWSIHLAKCRAEELPPGHPSLDHCPLREQWRWQERGDIAGLAEACDEWRMTTG
jgi:hypothetical protein